MSASITDTRADAMKAFLTAAAGQSAYDLDELAKLTTKPANYVEVYLSPVAGGEYRMDGTRDVSQWRLSTRVVASTISNARLIEDNITAAFKHTTVDLGDVLVQVDYESGGGAFELDGASYTALTDWTFGV